MLKRNKRTVLFIFITIMSFIAIYAGHFLLKDSGKAIEHIPTVPKELPIKYSHISTILHGKPQEINILEVNPGESRVKIKPALSYNSIFGFEKLSDIAQRNKAYAAVNAGFFYQFGNPSGLVMADGKLLSLSKGKFPIFLLQNGKASIEMWNLTAWIECGEKRVKIENINPYGVKKGISLFTEEYGIDNRVGKTNYSIVIQNNTVISLGKYPGKVKIPEDGMLLTLQNPTEAMIKQLPFSKGSSVHLVYEPEAGRDANAYECGSWLVRAGKVVIGERDPWVGVLTNRDPRTLIGIKGDGTVVLLTVDGRQPGFSAGMTGKELGEFARSYGLEDAAMLDGGASTEMIVEGRVVNRPSAQGQERPIGGGLLIFLEDKGE